MTRPIKNVVGIVSVVAALIISPGRLPAQDVIRLEGRPLFTTPVLDKEDRPQAPAGEEPAAMMTMGGDTVITRVAYSPDGETLAVGDGPNRPICVLGGLPPMNPNGGLIRLIDTRTNRVRATLGPDKKAGHEYEVKDLRFSPDGSRLISYETDTSREQDGHKSKGHFTVWDLTRGKPSVVLAERNQVFGRGRDYDVAPDGRSLVAIDDDRMARTWDVESGQSRPAVRASDDPRRRATCVKFSPDGRSLALGLVGGATLLVDAASGRRLASFPDGPDDQGRFEIDLLAFAPGGRLLASKASFLTKVADKWITISTLRLFDLTEGRELPRPHVLDDEMFYCMTFTPDGQALVTGGPDAVVKVWDATTGRERTSFKRWDSWVLSLAFSPDGKVLAAGDRNSITLWDPATGKERASLPETFGDVNQLSFHPHGKALASTGGTLRVWDVRAALAPRFDEGHISGVTSLAYSPDGKTLASASKDCTVKVWDLGGRKPRATLRGHEDEVTSVAYTPDGKGVISGSRDRTVRLWEPREGKERARLVGHSVPVASGPSLPMAGRSPREAATASDPAR